MAWASAAVCRSRLRVVVRRGSSFNWSVPAASWPAPLQLAGAGVELGWRRRPGCSRRCLRAVGVEGGGELHAPAASFWAPSSTLYTAGASLLFTSVSIFTAPVASALAPSWSRSAPGASFPGDAGLDLLGPFRELASAGVGWPCAGGEFARAVLQLLGAGAACPLRR